MESHATPTQDKPITVDVPAERLPEFYAMYARFLAGRRRGRRGRGPGHRHPHHRGGHGCGHGHAHGTPHGSWGDAPVTEV